MTELDPTTRNGLAICAVSAAAFSAVSQFEVARLAHVTEALAWVLPVTTDAAAFVATRVWLDKRFRSGIRKYAAGIVILCVALSIAGAAFHTGLSDTEPPPPWLGFAVGGIPSLILAGLIHLIALMVAPDKSIKAAATPRPKAAPKTVSAAGHAQTAAPAAPTPVPAAKPTPAPEEKTPPKVAAAAVPDVGKGSMRDQMLAYLDQHGETTGAELDRIFGTSNYGRGVLKTWRKRHPIASGE